VAQPLSPSREWNSSEYHRLSAPQVSWGKKVLARLQLRGDESLLDAGCGTGRLTAELLQALPGGRVVALDVSQNMLRSAREYLQPQFGQRTQFVAANMPDLPFENVFDGIVSTAAFHWVLDHDRLFRNLHRALRHGGWLQAQCGGFGNIAQLRERMDLLAGSPEYAPYLASFPSPWLFQDAEAAATTLRRAGFVNIQTGLEPALIIMEDRQQYTDFLQTMIARTHLECLPDRELRERYVSALADLAENDDPPFLLDYTRLNLIASKP
jgi:trans-aconitate 2-methyltransferase